MATIKGWAPAVRNFFIRQSPELLLVGVVLVGLYAVAQTNYLLFHTLAELFSIVIGFTTFIITWNARRFFNNACLPFIGLAFLYVAGFALLHALSYDGMNIFSSGPEIPTQLWLAERFTLAVSMVLAPLFLNRRPRGGFFSLVVLGFGAFSLFLLLAIFNWRIFPTTIIPGVGLTPFKIGSEYFILLLFLGAAVFLMRSQRAFEPQVIWLLIAAMAFNMLAEFLFTTYLSVTDGRNLAGHILVILAYYCIYKAIIQTGLEKPYELVFREASLRERELLDSQALETARITQIEAILESVPAIMRITHDPQAKRVVGNRTAYEFLHVEPGTNLSPLAEESKPFIHYRAFHAEDELPIEKLPLQATALTGQAIRDYEETIVFDNGEKRRLLGNTNPLYDPQGHLTGAVAAFIDITERVKTEQALAESEQRFRSLFETMQEGFLLMEAVLNEQEEFEDVRIIDVNPAFEAMAQKTRDQLVGQTLREVSPSASPVWRENYGKVAMTGQPLEFEDYSVLTGKRFEVKVFQPAPGRCAALLSDVTERRKSQEALRLSEARLRRLVDSNIIGIIFANEDGSVQVANDAFLTLIGYSRAELEAGLVNWVTLTPSNYLSYDLQGIAEARERGACSPYEKEFIRKGGAFVPILIGYAYFTEATPALICFILDLTDARLAESRLKSYALQLERSNRELQDFAFVASHDLQEPLRKIQAFGDRLKTHLNNQLNEEDRDFLDRMLNASVRMRTMISDLLALSRITTRVHPFESVDLNETMKEVISDLEVRIASTSGKVEVGPLPRIEADPLQMHQLLLNLVGNALKFHKEDDPPKVSVTCEFTSDPDEVTISVMDNGIGFEEEYADRIFQPFQRLHGLGLYEGSGIGLAICRRIVERHSGKITAHSSLGAGATFMVSLPMLQDGAAGVKSIDL